MKWAFAGNLLDDACVHGSLRGWVRCHRSILSAKLESELRCRSHGIEDKLHRIIGHTRHSSRRFSCPPSLNSSAVQAFLRGAVSPMSEVLAGDFDLRVPIVTAVIDSYTKLSISDVVVDLVVSTESPTRHVLPANGYPAVAIGPPELTTTL